MATLETIQISGNQKNCRLLHQKIHLEHSAYVVEKRVPLEIHTMYKWERRKMVTDYSPREIQTLENLPKSEVLSITMDDNLLENS